MKMGVIILSICILISWSAQEVWASRQDAYASEISKARLFNKKAGYRKMQQVLLEAQDFTHPHKRSALFQLFLKIQETNNIEAFIKFRFLPRPTDQKFSEARWSC